MKITGVRVEDPALDGYMNNPRIIVSVSEPLKATEEPEYFTVDTGVYRVRRYGPFFRYGYFQFAGCQPYRGHPDSDIGLGQMWSSRAGAFNRALIPDQPLVDVIVEEGNGPPVGGWAMRLPRIQKELKRFAPDWYLVVDENMAKHGDIAWVPAETIPGCLWRGKFSPRRDGDPPVCGKAAYHPFMGRHLGLCDEHKVEHDQFAARQRAGNQRQVSSRRP